MRPAIHIEDGGAYYRISDYLGSCLTGKVK